jgi:hypothetical protein
MNAAVLTLIVLIHSNHTLVTAKQAAAWSAGQISIASAPNPISAAAEIVELRRP